MIAQGCPNGDFSQYGTVFGCANTEYGILIYEDVFGNQAIWSQTLNVWDINNLVTTNKTITGAINNLYSWLSNLGTSTASFDGSNYSVVCFDPSTRELYAKVDGTHYTLRTI